MNAIKEPSVTRRGTLAAGGLVAMALETISGLGVLSGQKLLSGRALGHRRSAAHQGREEIKARVTDLIESLGVTPIEAL